jgi:CheY-like chemotaxis protein
MRILVVEDNLINQQVAQELLLHEGATIALAENGRVGVDMVAAANEAFDVVLMDLQMPVMDGLTAVRAIRMGLGLSNLPVIAMTANAMATDREACLQAGMNDHVGKPFDLDELVAVLIRWTRWPAKEVTSAFVRDGALDGDLAQTTFAWPPGVDGQAALQRMGGNCGLLVRTLRSYINDASNLVDRLSGLLAAQDAAAIVRELHSFKGLSATLGVRGLAGDAAAAEAMAREAGLAGGMADTLQHLGQEVGRVLPVLRELAVRLEGLVQTEGGESGKPAAWGASRPTPPVQPLRELLALLLNGDMAALELHADLRQNAQLELAGSASDLDGAMAELDFGRAAVACRNLIEQLEQ